MATRRFSRVWSKAVASRNRRMVSFRRQANPNGCHGVSVFVSEADQKLPTCQFIDAIATGSPVLGRYLLAMCLFVVCVPAENISQVAMNMAAITGPITNPLRPKSAMPPSVEISTT
jgi:hypothetical protein